MVDANVNNQYSSIYSRCNKCKSDLTTTDNTLLYTVPTDADFNAAVVNSILVSEDSNNGDDITVTL